MARGRGGMVPGKKMKNEAVTNKMKKENGKRRKGKGESDFFFVNIWHTFVDNCILTLTFHDPFRGKKAAGEKG